MAEMDMVDRVARAICREECEPAGCSYSVWDDSLSEIDRGKYRDLARAAIEAIFKGSRFIEMGGMTLIANPDFPAQYWDGERMQCVQPATRVLDAALSDTSAKG